MLRVRINPSNIRLTPDTDYSVWTIVEGSSASTTLNGVTLTLAAASNSILSGGSYKVVYNKFLSSFGERIIGEGITTDADSTGTKIITLSIKGLTVGTHTLLVWHNAWDNLSSAGTVAVTVDGKSSGSFSQSVRKDNIWEAGSSYVTLSVTSTSQTVQVVYTPSGGDGRAFLNGLEIDSPSLGNQLSFPIPRHRDERVDLKGASTTTASWRAPKSASPTYNIYLGTSATTLKSVSLGQTGTSVTLPGEANIYLLNISHANLASKV